MNGQIETHCLYCSAVTNGTMYCSEAHRKRYKRLPAEERTYPRVISPGMRENRCHVHGEVFTETWLDAPWKMWHTLTGCRQCKQLAAIRPKVEEIMRERQSEITSRVEAEMKARADDLARDIEHWMEIETARLREHVTGERTNVLRGIVGSDVRHEMEQEIIAELLKGETVCQ